MSAKKVISLSVDPEIHDQMRVAAKKMGWGVSEMVRNLVTKYMDLLVNDDDQVPVVLRIPAELKEDPDGLKAWLEGRSAAIVQALTRQ